MANIAETYRSLLKTALRKHPLTDDQRRIVDRGQTADREALATFFQIDFEALRAEAARIVMGTVPIITPATASTQKDTATVASTQSTQHADADAITKHILAPLADGDFDELKRRLRDLATEAAKPARVVEVERIVDRPVEVERIVTVERIVEVSAPPAGNRPAHMPAKTGKSVDVLGYALDVWDAPDAPQADPHWLWSDALRPALAMLATGDHVMLHGPAGTGKTGFAEQLAAATCRPFVRILCHQETSPMDWTGGFMPDGSDGLAWRDGVLTRALRRAGSLILVDEPSLARPEAQAVLHSVMEPRGTLTIDATGEIVRVAPGVSVILADNTNGRGDATGLYAGTGRMNGALLDRCGVSIPMPWLCADQERDVIAAKTGLAKKHAGAMVEFATLTRQKAEAGALAAPVGLRRLLAWAKLIKAGLRGMEAFAPTVIHGAPHDDQETLRQLYSVAFASTAQPE